MAVPLGGEPAECTITGYCRTSIFKYPGSYLVAGVDHHVVYSCGGLKAAIVSDLLGYFEQSSVESVHYSIAVSLRAGVHRTYQTAFDQAIRSTDPDTPLFLVIEEYESIPPTALDSGECFSIDECIDGMATIKGGREGKRTLLVFETCDGSWPDFHPDNFAINVVLAAVKAEQRFIHHIEELYSCACFVSSEGLVVYTMSSEMSVTLQTVSRLESGDVQKIASGIASMIQAMISESDPTARELCDSMVLDKTDDDGYFRLWYLRLWQAVEDAQKYLGYPQLGNTKEVIAGKRTPKELKAYRNEIAHWHTGKIDFSYLNDLQYTAMELLRRKYRSTAVPLVPGRSEWPTRTKFAEKHSLDPS